MILRALLATLALVLTSAAEKLELVDGYVLVHAYLNDRGPFLFLLDTGAATSAVTPTTARLAGLVPDERVTLVTATGETTVPASRTADIRIGDVRAAGVETMILPLDTVRRIHPLIVGILGQSFLSRFPCLIDYRAGRLWLGDEATRRAGRIPASFAVAVESVDGRVAVPVTIDRDRPPFHLVLDSGASTMTLACGHRCPRLQDPVVSMLHTNTGERRVASGVLREVTIGALRIPHPAAALLDAAPQVSQEDGVLPANWFSSIYLDPSRDQVLLAR